MSERANIYIYVLNTSLSCAYVLNTVWVNEMIFFFLFQMTLEKEEQERKELQRMIMDPEDKDGDKRKGAKKDEDESSQFGFGTPGTGIQCCWKPVDGSLLS